MRAEGDLLALLGRHEHEREKETDRERERETEAAVSLRPQDTRLRLPRCMRAYARGETRCETGGDGGGEDSRRIPMAKWLSYLNGRAAASRQSATL